MQILFGGTHRENFRSKELARLVERAQELSDGEYDLLEHNYKPLSALVKKILILTRQEKEWKVYFDAIYYMLFLQLHNHNYKEMVRYAEVYYRESALHMEQELPNYRDTDMAVNNIYIYDMIFEAYYCYAQIDDAKMELFMENFRDAVFRYGGDELYYDDEMLLGILYRDVDRAKAAAGNYLKHENEINSCYVCRHKNYLKQLILAGQEQQAEELMQRLIHKDIPKKYQWCYLYCQNAVSDEMYIIVLETCIQCGKTDTFHYIFEKYWRELPPEKQWDSEGDSFRRMLCALDGYFDRLGEDLREAEEAGDAERYATVENMEIFLGWWCYFILLDRSGVHEVSITLPEPGAGENGLVPTRTVSSYMEKQADSYGRSFARARAQFDYDARKESYRECVLSGKICKKE